MTGDKNAVDVHMTLDNSADNDPCRKGDKSDSTSESVPNPSTSMHVKKPVWLKVHQPGGEAYTRVKRTLSSLKLHTVCDEARCPNVAHCWGQGTATLMMLGRVCTRGCRFCAVTSGHPDAPDDSEPQHIASAVAQLGLRYVVLTMVTRDDLPDGGAGHVAKTVRALRQVDGLLIEVLVSDFQGNSVLVDTVLEAAPDVFGHNVEVVRRLSSVVRDRRCSYERSLQVLEHASKDGSSLIKSGVMLGFGESDDEVRQCLCDLRRAGVDIVTIGQYLQPSPVHLAIDRYVTPEQFEGFREFGQKQGIRFVASGPLVRSSYGAAQVFDKTYALRFGDRARRATT